MRTIEIPRKDWQRALDEFSTVHDGWLVSLDVLGPTLGVQPEIRDLPLRGVTAEAGGPDPTIMISAARDDGEHITHIIHSPTHVRLEKTNEGADVALQVESLEGMATILRFKTVALPENVDGMPAR
jgi:hypothetical protein